MCRIGPRRSKLAVPATADEHVASQQMTKAIQRSGIAELLLAPNADAPRPHIIQQPVGAYNELLLAWPTPRRALHSTQPLTDDAVVLFFDSFAPPMPAAAFLCRPRRVLWCLADVVCVEGSVHRIHALRILLLERGNDLPLPSASYVPHEIYAGISMARGYVYHPLSGQLFRSDRIVVDQRTMRDILRRAAGRGPLLLFGDAEAAARERRVRIHGPEELRLTRLGAVPWVHADCIADLRRCPTTADCLVEGMGDYVLVHHPVPCIDAPAPVPAPRPIWPRRAQTTPEASRGEAAMGAAPNTPPPLFGSPILNSCSRSSTATANSVFDDDDATTAAPFSDVLMHIMDETAVKRARVDSASAPTLSHFSSIGALPPVSLHGDGAASATPVSLPQSDEDDDKEPSDFLDRFLNII